MTDKEYIIINGRKQYCKILFRCNHIDDTAAYDMMCEGIEITPENAPVSHSELMLIENTENPFGFSFICKINNKNNKEDEWEHSGFGNSGACSIVTALLKQLICKTQECEELKDYAKRQENQRETYYKEFLKKDKALEEIEEITQNHIINDFSNWNMGEISDDIVADYVTANCKQILDIINKAKGDKNG